MKTKLIHDNCLTALKKMDENSVDSVVTDPPYGLSFMGKRWDYDVPSEEIWRECLRVLKPGGYLLSFCGTRTYHRMAVAIEDAGFEIRDMIEWVYGSGFPKSLNIGKAVARLEGEDIPKTKGFNVAGQGIGLNPNKELRSDHPNYVKPTFNNEYEGWGTALKPAHEPICMARKPLSEKTVAENCLKWGTGGINIDESRVGTSDKYSYPNGAGGNSFSVGEEPDGKRTEPVESNSLGRFPANLIHDNSEEVRECFPETKTGNIKPHKDNSNAEFKQLHTDFITSNHTGDSGNASRFFKSIIYMAKASKRDRDEGCEGLPEVTHQSGMGGAMPTDDDGKERDRFKAQPRNHHPTVKPTDLMRYLCRMVTPKGGIVLDPFMGSGSTGKAALLEGFQFIGIEREAEYVAIAKARIENNLPLLT